MYGGAPMNAFPMIASCAERQDPNIPLDMKAVANLGSPAWVILWDAYVPRVQNIGYGGFIDGPPRTWTMVLK